MKLIIWVEPLYSTSNWFSDLKRGLISGLNHKHLKADFNIIENPDESVDKSSIIVLAGETYEWYDRMLEFTNTNRILSCVTACEYPMHSEITILTDYSQVCYDSIQYLADAGRRRIALFGVNPSSPHDNARLETYRKAIANMNLDCTADDIYFTAGKIDDCIYKFIENIKKYDAVLGTNDLYAIAAMEGAKKAGINVPADLYVMGTGNTELSKLSRPPLTTSTVDLYNVGYQTINAIQLLTNANNGMIGLKIKNKVEYFIRESTECKAFSGKYERSENLSNLELENEKGITSFGDDSFMYLVNCEILFSHLDATDYNIIQAISKHDCQRRSQLADYCFLSDTALDYRLRKFYKRFKISSYNDFYKTIKEMSNVFDFDKLEPIT